MTKPLGDLSRKWDQRIERARELAGQYPFATEVLTFYAKLAAFQQGFYSRLQSTFGSTTAGALDGQLSPELNPHEIKALMPQFRPFLSFLTREGPSAMADFAARLEKSDPGDWAQLLKRFWRRNERDRKESRRSRPGTGGAGAVGDRRRSLPMRASGGSPLWLFYSLTWSTLPTAPILPAPAVRRPVCPFCGSKPLAGVLRPEGEGAKRSLVCSFCFTEWDYLRIACPACEESRDEKMCVYTASQV